MLTPHTQPRCKRPATALPRFLHGLSIAVAISICVHASAAETAAPDSFQIDYSAHPDATALLAFDLSILSPDADADLKPGQALGNRFFGYLSLTEVAPDASYRSQAEATGVTFPALNAQWKSRVADISDPRWHDFVLDHLARPIIIRGFDGFFLDTADSVELLAAAEPDRATAFREGLETLIRKLHQRFPEKQIILNRGFDSFDQVNEVVDGVLVESVLRSFDFSSQEYVAVEAATTKRLEMQIQRVRDAGLPVYAVDYVPGDDPELARATSAQLRRLACIPLLTTPDLKGAVFGWNRRIARRILVLHGHDPLETESPKVWPADTTTTSILQMPLEWMGYELEYHDVSLGLPEKGDSDAWAGVIVDDETTIPPRHEEAYCDWLISRQMAGGKLLFVGDFPFADDALRRRLFDALGIPEPAQVRNEHPTATALPMRVKNPNFTVVDETVVNFEVDARPSIRDFQNLQAPDGARVLLSVAAENNAAERVNFDAVYTASWGGCLLSPYVVFEASEETVLTYVDPFAFLNAIWPQGRFPAPDPSTRDGLRAFYTHIDGDGFTSLTNVEKDRLCGEFLYDRILRDLPFPITVSIVEAEIRTHMLLQNPSQQERFETAARKIFALPQVEPASHSYSHPYIWIDDDDDAHAGHYASRNLDLKFTTRYLNVTSEREVAGSIDYINRTLTPPEKPATMMLWSGNCRPGAESLRIAGELGIECMNGGNTILSSRYPGLSAVAPRTIYWEDQLQVYASNQNEFMYTNGWQGPYYGGFRQVIETFEMTESPRRLKPVNVYYHFYSVERHDALKAIEDIYAWCSDQPLHSLSTSQFAALTRDSHNTALYRTGPRRWVALNEGHLRTFRLPTRLGEPDLRECRGVTGYVIDGDWIYLHTNGSKKTTIALADRAAPHLRLRTSSAEIEFQKLGPQVAIFSVEDLRPVTVTLGGAEAGQRVILDIDGERGAAKANAKGIVSLELPEKATVRIAFAP